MRRFFCTIAMVSAAGLVSAPALADQQEDKAAAEQIATILRDSGQMRNYSVGVKYKNGTVWLSGRVADEQQLQAALSVVSEIEGIEQIVNNLSTSPGETSLRQPIAQKTGSSAAQARRASAEMAMPAAKPIPRSSEHVRADGQVTEAGYHFLAARKAARHACPPTMYAPGGGGANPPAYDQPYLPNYAWPSYAANSNYAALTYPQQYSPTAWPFIGPFYPYPQVPLGWRKVALEWDDGWWFLDFYDRGHH
jgi:BON domain